MHMKDLFESTAAHPQTLVARISAIKNSLPSSSPLDTAELLNQQEKESMTMAKHLEDLAHHFGQMETALNEHEAGDVVGEEDMQSKVDLRRYWMPTTLILSIQFSYETQRSSPPSLLRWRSA